MNKTILLLILVFLVTISYVSAKNCGRTNVGECTMGVEVCHDGVWGECNAVMPIEEVCGNDIDDDCDGQVDEGCGTGSPIFRKDEIVVAVSERG